MKNYRACIADVYALRDVLEYLAERADDFAKSAADYSERAKGPDGDDDCYCLEQAAEYQAKGAAFERLLVKFSK